jgi:3-oxoacyl-[acyl-carrier protein] reductase
VITIRSQRGEIPDAIARELARQGANVTITYVSDPTAAAAVVSDIKAESVEGRAYQADQGDPVQVDRMVKAVVAETGKLDIVINSAGISAHGRVGARGIPTHEIHTAGPEPEYDPDEDVRERYAVLDRLWKVNVGGLIALVRAAARRMNDGGRIIAIGSMSGNSVPLPGWADYCSTKAAVGQLCRGWARDLGPRNITVNAVQPGPLNTDLHAEGDDWLSKDLRARSCLGRFGRIEEVAPVVAFLAGPHASYITGARIDIDGGCSA